MKEPFIVRLYNFVRDGLAVIGGLLICAMVIYVSLSVVTRLFGYSIGWTLEVAEYSLIILTMFGAGWLLKNRGHTRIDIFLDLIKSPRTRGVVEGVLYIVTTALSLFLLVLSIMVTWDNYASKMLQVKIYTFPKWWLCAIIVIGFFFLFIESAKLMYGYFKGPEKK